MSDAATTFRLDGLEPDNLLAFLALIGLVRALDVHERELADNERVRARVAWDIDAPPLRPVLVVHGALTRDTVLDRVAAGIDAIAVIHEFGGRKDLNHSRDECRALLARDATTADLRNRDHIDLLAALMTDAAVKDEKTGTTEPTPLCLLFGQGHQHFLDRLASVPRLASPPPRGKGASRVSATECLEAALFRPWQRTDTTFSFRWDPEEDVRYALMAGDPTDSAYTAGTQHGANRLAAVGLAALTVVPVTRGRRVRASVIGWEPNSFAWPIWRDPVRFAGIRALLAHQQLRKPGALKHLGVDQVMLARRISVGKFLNFTRARPASNS